MHLRNRWKIGIGRPLFAFAERAMKMTKPANYNMTQTLRLDHIRWCDHNRCQLGCMQHCPMHRNAKNTEYRSKGCIL